MIKDLATARGISEDLLRVNDLLDESVARATRGCSTEELRAYKKWVGRTLCSVFEEILVPIYREHPELKPPELEI